MIEFDIPDLALVIGLLVSVGAPLLVGLVTKVVTDSGVKAAILAAIAAATGFGVELGAALNAGETFNMGTALLLALFSFLTGVGMHYGLWKPTGVSIKAQEVGVK